MEQKLKFVNILEEKKRQRPTAGLKAFEYSYPAEITNIYPMTENERLYQIKIIDEEERNSFSFKPGQFVMFEVPGIGEAPFSISSSSVRKGVFDLCIRHIGNLTNFLSQVKLGMRVGISGPFGSSFPIEDMVGQNILLIAGGLGIVPLRAPILSVLENRSSYRKVDIIYGAKKPRELLYTYEYEMWKKFDISLNIIVDQADETWQGDTGLITKPLAASIAGASPTFPTSSYAIVCGPPVMYKFVCKLLIEAGVPARKIFVSLERRMHCGRGKCCRCNIGSTYTCLDGPVFDYWSVMNLKEAI